MKFVHFYVCIYALIGLSEKVADVCLENRSKTLRTIFSKHFISHHKFFCKHKFLFELCQIKEQVCCFTLDVSKLHTTFDTDHAINFCYLKILDCLYLQ